ncbi:MAG: contractile injection system tape measure protein [Methylobacter sp.]
MSSLHTIQQQHLHVKVLGTETDARELQNRLSGWCHDDLLPALEKIFDQFSETGTWCINLLDIDAGELTLENMENNLAAIVALAVEKELRELTLNKPSLAVISNNIHYKTGQQNLAEALVYFLTTGRLPWSLQLPAGKNFEQILLDTSQDCTPISTNPHLILKALTSVTARKRLVRQFSPLLMARILAQFSPDGKKIIETILQKLQTADTPPDAIKLFEKQLWETLFSFIATARTMTENAVVAETWQTLNIPIAQLTALESSLPRYWPAIIKTTIKTPDTRPSSLTTLEKEKPPLYRTTTHQTLDSLADTPQKNSQHISQGNQSLEAANIKENIYIENAGLILLHPFLPQFFTALGIAAENQLVQPERALCLLHFLTTGLLIAPEYELTLCKILCNIPLESLVESDMELTESETEEAEALLKAVIRHWDALRNTGIDGLRGEFFLRFGKLFVRADGDWLLQVEAKTVDLLLNQLPWGISMIQLPWMQRILWVEWSY